MCSFDGLPFLAQEQARLGSRGYAYHKRCNADGTHYIQIKELVSASITALNVTQVSRDMSNVRVLINASYVHNT